MKNLSYEEAAHAMQTGVAMKMEMGIGKEAEPKHLRAGINSAMSDHAALVGILIKKGIFTEKEYFEAIREQMNREAESYERDLEKHLGIPVNLR